MLLSSSAYMNHFLFNRVTYLNHASNAWFWHTKRAAANKSNGSYIMAFLPNREGRIISLSICLLPTEKSVCGIHPIHAFCLQYKH